jgi:hypothetical protein
MISVWKFDLTIAGAHEEVKMPAGATLLSAQVQHGGVRLWAKVDTDAPIVTRTMYVCGTGHRAPVRGSVFVATVQMAGGALVWHIFDIGEAPAEQAAASEGAP